MLQKYSQALAADSERHIAIYLTLVRIQGVNDVPHKE